MNTFSVSVFSLSFVLGVCSFLLYGNKLEAFCKRVYPWLLFAAILSFLPVSLSPLLRIPDFSLPDASSGFSEVTQNAVEKGLSSAVSERFGIDDKDLRVVIVGFSAEALTADKVTVFLSGRAVFADQTAIRAFIEEQNLGRCEVVYE